MRKLLVTIIFSIFVLTGCASTHKDVLGTSQSQVQMRNYQTRSFYTKDKNLVLRAIISTMQDLGFIIDKADKKLGIVSGTSFMYPSKLTVSIRPSSDEKQIIVRANAQDNLKMIEEPVSYQNFFNSLSQSLLLEAHEIE